MSTNHRGHVRRAAAWTASVALFAVSFVGVVATSASAHPATHSNKGKLQLCTAASKAKSSSFTIKGHGHTYTRTLHPSAYHTVCGKKMSLAKGSYKISQRMVSGEHVGNIKVSPSYAAYTRDTVHASTHVAVRKAKSTKVTFYDVAAKKAAPAPTPPSSPPSDPGTGYLEVCKVAGDQWVTGEVTASITAGAFSMTGIHIPVGQCTNPIQVPAGNVTITETTVPYPDYLSLVTTNPTSALVSYDSNSNSTVVTVAQSADQSTETTAWLTNSTAMGYFKVCKTLGTNATALLGDTFTFDVSYQMFGSGAWVSAPSMSVLVPADGSVGTSYCRLSSYTLPLGSIVKITEEAYAGAQLSGVSVAPASQDAGSTSTTALLTIGPNRNGTTTATFTNDGVGTIEICKQMDDPWILRLHPLLEEGQSDPNSPFTGVVFTFLVNGQTVKVAAGQCSAPITVPAGTATVSEASDPDFVLEGFTATGPDGDNRIVSGTNPITVSVPVGGVGNETLVIATNRVKEGQVKVCKIIGPGVKLGLSYNFTTTFSIGGSWYEQDLTLTPTDYGTAGEVCGFVTSPLPIITDAQRDPVKFASKEGPSPIPAPGSDDPAGYGIEPDSITYQGNGTVVWSNVWSVDNADDDGNYGICATLGNGVNVVTFTNDVVDPGVSSS